MDHQPCQINAKVRDICQFLLLVIFPILDSNSGLTSDLRGEYFHGNIDLGP